MENIFLPLQRVIILQGIETQPGRELSNEMIQRLLKTHGHRVSIADVNEQIAWLENRGYAKAARLAVLLTCIFSCSHPHNPRSRKPI
jgi:Fe2+ or Zn2+ uptake regulation protein